MASTASSRVVARGTAPPPLDGSAAPLARGEAQDAAGGLQPVQAGVLDDDRPPRRQIAGAAVAEPAAAAGDVAVLRDRELRARGGDEPLVVGGRARGIPARDDVPAVDPVRLAQYGQAELSVAVARHVAEGRELTLLVAVGASAVGDLAVAAPLHHRREGGVAGGGSLGPERQVDRRQRLAPLAAAGRDLAAGLADALADGEE